MEANTVAWTPAHVRQPDSRRWVLATLRADPAAGQGRTWTTIARWEAATETWHPFITMGAPYGSVVAWMDLPTPWLPDGEEAEYVARVMDGMQCYFTRREG